ncbi:PAS/PAC sensor signal transduction histidine kinase [Fibrisoma limi BUZ 3]|uniref:histidine kinase n=1 Tax=Fibrisoma limi BUZ 3 TaxID=1185876 RepID=I2GLU3_9BACT|nr:ATP-binding protein [Fibrisoma limi]CCH54869.1 PAS/PAC sensor signal transduction histidine kinase [Fibrisoma limi BUZ 3]
MSISTAPDAKRAEARIELLPTQQPYLDVLDALMEGTLSAFLYCVPILENGEVTDFQYIWGNRKAHELVNLNPEQFRQTTMLQLFPYFRQTGLFNRYITAWLTGEPQRFEREHIIGDSVKWVDVSVVKQGEGLVITALDITDSRQLRHQLHQQAQLLHNIVDNSPAGLVLYEPVLDTAGTIVDFQYVVTNASNARTTGRSVEEMVGNLLSVLFPDIYAQGFFDQLVGVHQTGQSQRVERRFQGDQLDVWVDGSLVKTDKYVLFTYQDITLLKQQQLALADQAALLREKNQALNRSNADLERFASVASHDMKEPLRKIKAFGDMLYNEYGGTLPTEALDLLKRMQTASARLMQLIDSLLEFSRITNDSDAFNPVALPNVLHQVLQNLDVSISEQQATITVGDLPTVLGSAFQLEQLFQNLLANAIKFRRPDAAPIIQINSLRLQPDQLPESCTYLTSTVPQAAGWWQIQVSDNGIGFQQQDADLIFQAFRKLHGRRQYEGAGLGLATVRQVAQNHRGTITTWSQPGQGATFTVYLPSFDVAP